ncbi:hypothetical protein [Treponema primitia]|uniref:hypothetical protein n=1 Tax=Treponema primitia TaxID=88058 RepID=UPI000255530F|nr:hypothetical protein [Treponema primitia]
MKKGMRISVLLVVMFLILVSCDKAKSLGNFALFSSYVLNEPIREETSINSNNWKDVSSYDDVLGNWSGSKFIPVSVRQFHYELDGDTKIGVRVGLSIDNQKDFVVMIYVDFNDFLDDGIRVYEKKFGTSISKDDVWKEIVSDYPKEFKNEKYKITISQIIDSGFIESASDVKENGTIMINDQGQMKIFTEVPLPGSLEVNSKIEIILNKSVRKK